MLMRDWDVLFYGAKQAPITTQQLVEKLHRYAQTQLFADDRAALRQMVRHYLGLMHGLAGARVWRRMLSDAQLLKYNNPDLIQAAGAAMADEASHQELSLTTRNT